MAEQIQRYLSSELIPALRDPRMGFATVTSVDLSRDLKSARVYVTVYELDEVKRTAALKALNGASGLFRREMARELRLRYTPTLSFHEDVSIDRADRIERLIRDIRAQDPAAAEGAVTEGGIEPGASEAPDDADGDADFDLDDSEDEPDEPDFDSDEIEPDSGQTGPASDERESGGVANESGGRETSGSRSGAVDQKTRKKQPRKPSPNSSRRGPRGKR